MNLNSPNISDLKELIRNCDDENFNHLIWVSKDGFVNIYKSTFANPTVTFKNEVGDNLQFWKGVLHQGRNYVGEIAAMDTGYIESLLNELIANWKNNFNGRLEN